MHLRSRLAAVFVVAVSTAPAAAQTGLLVVAHGGNQAWNAGVATLMEQVRWSEGPRALAFLMGPAADSLGWSEGIESLVASGAKAIVIVPLMVSSHGGHYHQIRYYAGELDSLPGAVGAHGHERPARPPVPVRVTPSLDDAAELGAALLEHWRRLGPAAQRAPLVLVAHGPESDTEAERWVRNLEVAAGALREAGNIPVSIGLLRDDAPAPVRAAAVAALRETIRRHAATSADSVTVLPVLISSGSIDQVKLPADLAELPVRYARAPLVGSTAIARWVERIARSASASP